MKPSLLLNILFVIGITAGLTVAVPAEAGKRQKVIDFEDEVVEGMNKRPLDSLNQVSEKDRKKRRPHLYRKRAGFRNETYDALRSARYMP